MQSERSRGVLECIQIAVLVSESIQIHRLSSIRLLAVGHTHTHTHTHTHVCVHTDLLKIIHALHSSGSKPILDPTIPFDDNY